MVRQSGTVRIWWDVSIQAYRLSSTYSTELAAVLKTQIPVSDRSYDNTTKIWTFTERFLKPIEEFCKLAGLTITLISRQQADAASQGAPQAHTSANSGSVNPNNINGNSSLTLLCHQFMSLLPFDAAQTAFRKAALALHPDRPGGDMEKMSQLNIAWQRLEKDLYKQV